MTTELTHIDAQNNPSMVDVSAKAITKRVAVAESMVQLPPAVQAALEDGEIQSKKGPVFHTAIIAGVMAAKKTHELIPFCHPIGLENCQVRIEVTPESNLKIRCECHITSKTGVEMEALTGASVAALTIYDMCKALSHDLVIGPTRLVKKTGGQVRRAGGTQHMINIEFYGRLSQDFGQRNTQWDGNHQSIESIFDALCLQQQIDLDKSTIRPILNDAFSDWNAVPKTGDVVGFFPPASGG